MAARAFLDGSPIDRVLVGGGGARNPELIRALADRFAGIPVEPFDAAGVPAEAAEAMAFSLMGRNALLGIPNYLPRCTGAREGAVLGEIVPGDRGSWTLGGSELEDEAVVGDFEPVQIRERAHLCTQMGEKVLSAVELVLSLSQLFQAQVELV